MAVHRAMWHLGAYGLVASAYECIWDGVDACRPHLGFVFTACIGPALSEDSLHPIVSTDKVKSKLALRLALNRVSDSPILCLYFLGSFSHSSVRC
jgi:hypothetical protein